MAESVIKRATRTFERLQQDSNRLLNDRIGVFRASFVFGTNSAGCRPNDEGQSKRKYYFILFFFYSMRNKLERVQEDAHLKRVNMQTE